MDLTGKAVRLSFTGPVAAARRVLMPYSFTCAVSGASGFVSGGPRVCRRFVSARASAGRPTREDVDRISRGLGARRRGTGSRAVPHRLNADERLQFELAMRKRFVEVVAAGNRRERKGAPLVNTFRQWCDACARPAVFLHKESMGRDHVVVDLATLRGGRSLSWDPDAVIDALVCAASAAGAQTHDAGNAEGIEYLTAPELEHVWQAGSTWELPPVTLTFPCETRSAAKAVAKAVAAAWPLQTSGRASRLENVGPPPS
jgi:hypothetical protein